MFVPVIVVFGLTTAISAVVFDDHRHRKSFVGSIGLVASVSMYGSPLIVMVSYICLGIVKSIHVTRKFTICFFCKPTINKRFYLYENKYLWIKLL